MTTRRVGEGTAERVLSAVAKEEEGKTTMQSSPDSVL